jgi:hypothetical protein
MGLAERHQQDWADRVKGYLATILFFIAGVMSCVLGIIVHLMGG